MPLGQNLEYREEVCPPSLKLPQASLLMIYTFIKAVLNCVFSFGTNIVGIGITITTLHAPKARVPQSWVHHSLLTSWS